MNRKMVTLQAKYAIGEPVFIDRLKQIIAEVNEITFAGTAVRYHAVWFVNGELRQEWFDEWQLSSIDD